MKSVQDIPIDPWYLRPFHTFAFVSDAPSFFAKQRAKHGAVFRCSILGNTYVRAHGAEFAERIFKNSNDIAHAGPGWKPVLENFFPGGLLLSDSHEHIEHRRLLQHAFNKPAMLNYFSQIQRWSEQLVDQLIVQEQVDFFPFIKEKTLTLALQMFLGVDSSDPFGKQVAQAFVDTVAGTLAIVRYPIANNQYQRGINGRALLKAKFFELVKLRRQQPGSDLISYLTQATDEDGRVLSDAEVVDHVIFTMMAAHDTTASSITSLMYQVCEQPHWQEAIADEAKSVSQLSYADLNQLTMTEAIYKEVLRLYPPLVTVPRYLMHDVELAGYALPKGTRTGVNIYATHREAEHWQNPEQFDPERFISKEDKQHPYQFIPFGGGVHKCIGMHLALMESKILLMQIFGKTTVRRTDPSAHIRFKSVPIWHPKSPLLLEFNARPAAN